MAKTNFKYLVIAHLTGMALSGIAMFFMAAGDRWIITGVMALLSVSLIVQFLIYRVRPGWFKDKINNQP